MASYPLAAASWSLKLLLLLRLAPHAAALGLRTPPRLLVDADLTDAEFAGAKMSDMRALVDAEVERRNRGETIPRLLHPFFDDGGRAARLYTPKECNISLPEAELSRPVAEVMREHPQQDGFCHFGMNLLQSLCYVGRKNRNVTDFELIGDYTKKMNHTEEIRNIIYEGGHITTRNHIFPYDDLYCHGTGFFDLPREKLKDYGWWEARAISECDKLENEFGSNFGNQSWWDLDNHTVWETFRLTYGLEHNTDLGLPTIRELRQHAATKCAFNKAGLACDMAYCARFGCVLDGGYIGHGTECPPF